MIELSQVILYILLASMGFYAIIVLWFQINVFRGKAMKNPDGPVDSWHEQKIFYGIASADIFLSVPVTFVGIIMVFVSPRWGYYLLTLVSFWFLWANIMTTATSLRFEKPKISISWFIAFTSGALIGLAYIM
ncbi:MAG: hypothetical protein OEY88_11550 [Candidatus Bathyarchaeota archaeon]|nr:hypothetical protein [Candidatus Bathyarchaeota archaeon]